MSEPRFKLDDLISALGARRQAEGISWREVARQSGVSPSTLSRIQQGNVPDVETLGALVVWLGIPADHFLNDGEKSRLGTLKAVPPSLAGALGPLLKDKELSPEAAEALGSLIRSAYQLFKIIHGGGETRQTETPKARRRTR